MDPVRVTYVSSQFQYGNNAKVAQVVAEIMVRNLSTDQGPAFGKKSLEHDSTLIRSECCFGEFSSNMEAMW